MENSNLQGDRDELHKTLMSARRAQNDAEQAIVRLEKHMKNLEMNMRQERAEEEEAKSLQWNNFREVQARVVQLESERETLVKTVEEDQKRLQDSETQRDVLLPQLRSLTQDLRRVQSMDFGVLQGAAYMQPKERAEEASSSWEAKSRELIRKLSMAETECARKDGQVQQLELCLEQSRTKLLAAETQTKQWRMRSAQRDKESVWLRQNLRKMAPTSADNTPSATLVNSLLTGAFSGRDDGNGSSSRSVGSIGSVGSEKTGATGRSGRGASSKWLSKHEADTRKVISSGGQGYQAPDAVQVEQYGEVFVVGAAGLAASPPQQQPLQVVVCVCVCVACHVCSI